MDAPQAQRHDALQNPVLAGADLLCLSGGVPPDLPIVQAARQRGVPLSNDANLQTTGPRGESRVSSSAGGGWTNVAARGGHAC